MVKVPTTFAEILDLTDHGPDSWIGTSARYSSKRVYGGQVVAQALWAALRTVDPDFIPHSLHAYFIRGGNAAEPIRFDVDRLRNGRSFCVRSVVARQSTGAILNLSCSFQRSEPEADVQTARMPLVPRADEMHEQVDRWTAIMEKRTMRTYPGAGRSMGWVRLRDELPSDPRIHACGLAFSSDTVQFTSAHSLHPLHVPEKDHHETFMGASLDHAMWFHRAVRADAWHLYEWECRGLRGARGMTVGNLFSEDGAHVASIAQEVLLRERRKD